MSFSDIELRHLTALQTVSEAGTFGRAAEVLGYSQSAVSQQIAALERAIGASVFDRPGGPKPVTLTPVGELLVRHAATVQRDLANAASEVEQLLAGELGTLTIGTFQSVSVAVLPQIIERLRRARPDLTIELFESDDNEVLGDRLRSGELDLTFVVEAWHTPGVTAETLYVDPFVLTSRADESTGPTVRYEAIIDAPLIGQPSNQCQILIDRALRAGGVEPAYVFRTSDNAAVQAMVRAGMGQAVMPLLAVDVSDTELCFRELDPPIPPRHIQLAWPTDRTQNPAAGAFSEIAREVFAEVSSRAARLPIRA